MVFLLGSRVYDFLELVEVQLIAIFKSSIALSLLLDSVVGQMDELIFAIVQLVFLATRSQIPFFAEVYFKILINEDPNANIEFPLIYQIWSFDILLYYERLVSLDHDWILSIGVF